MDSIQHYLKAILNLLERLSFNQKIAVGTLLIAAIGVSTLFFQSGQNDFDVMFSGLDESDATSVVYDLRKQGIPYKLADEGTTVMVPSRQKEALRLGAFKDDLIKNDNTLGFDGLSSLPFGLTSWQEQKYDQKIVSEEVVKTLQRIEGIKKARVILATPKKSVFEDDASEASASVMIIAEPGLRIKANQIRTIRQLVAHAVPGLKPENVTVADSSGNTLADDANSPHGNGESQTEVDVVRSGFEKQKARDITELLTPLAGPNNVVVKVNAVMNFDHVESKTKRLIPNGGNTENPTGIPVSIQNKIEDYNGTKPSGTGEDSGTKSNSTLPTIGVGQANSKGSEKGYKNQQTTTNYEVSSEEKTTVETPGKIEHLSIAVVVNKVLTEAENKELRDLITSAGGLDTTRGDTLSISGRAFAAEIEESQKLSMDVIKQNDMNGFILNIASIGGLFVLGFVALFIFYKLLSGMGNSLTASYSNDYDEEQYDSPSYNIGHNNGGRGPLGQPSGALASLSSSSQGQNLQGQSSQNQMSLSATETLNALNSAHLASDYMAPALSAKVDPEIEIMKSAISGMVQKDPVDAARLIQLYIKEG